MRDNKAKNRIGEVNLNRFGSKMIIVEYNNNKDVLVEFEKGNCVRTEYKKFKQGGVKNPYDKSVCGIGYLGEGKYKVSIDEKITPQYICWNGMMSRCYDKKLQEKIPSYIGCTVAEEWHNFQVFAKWYDENYYEIEGRIMCLDKDILIKGNKIYSKDTCIFAPSNINSLFVKCNIKRGEYPIGVSFDKSHLKYMSKCKDGNKKNIYLGLFDTPEQAFQSYKIFKENLIKQIANEYEKKIPKRLYNAMMSYNVDTSD